MGLGAVLLQGPLVGQLLGALRALLLPLLRGGAALHMGQHPTLEGKAPLTPAAGVGLGGGGGVCWSINGLLILFRLFFFVLVLPLFFTSAAVLLS